VESRVFKGEASGGDGQVRGASHLLGVLTSNHAFGGEAGHFGCQVRVELAGIEAVHFFDAGDAFGDGSPEAFLAAAVGRNDSYSGYDYSRLHDYKRCQTLDSAIPDQSRRHGYKRCQTLDSAIPDYSRLHD